MIDLVAFYCLDLLHVFSYLMKNLNFIDHTSNIGWKEYEHLD